MVPADSLDLGGMRRSLEIGLRIAPSTGSAHAAAKGLSAILDMHRQTPIRLAGLGSSGSRVHITLAVGMGTVEDVREGAPSARSALAALQAIVDHCSPYDPAFVALPARDSLEARIAEALAAMPAESWTLADAVRDLAGVH